MLHSCLLIVTLCAAAPEEDLTCLKPQPGAAPAKTDLYFHLQQETYAALAKRDEAWQQLKTAEQVQQRQKSLRKFFTQQLGGFPERTPLNSRVVGKLPGDGYTIEKVIFESRPHHHVTANLYLPDGPGPHPGVIVSSGHSRTAKTAAYNQRFGISLAKHGLAALCYDPIGQGERSQILDAEGRPQFSGTTTEHFLVGVGSILVGRNTAGYRVWDGMRAIDYLTGRDDIDPQRIGMTGCSGGGTLTSYVMALDDRVACAAPACYLTTFGKLIETIGPQDAEQNIFGQIARGMDQPDYILMRAPKPTIISATTSDFFGVDGTWINYRQSKRIYGLFGLPERIDLVEVAGDHGVQPTNLAAITQFMRRWLLNKDEPVKVEEFSVRPESELVCLEQGQVLLLPGEQSVFDLNAAEEQRLAAGRKELWAKNKAEALASVRKIAGIRPLAEIPEAKREKAGKVTREDYHIDKLVLHGDAGVPLPALTFHPKEPQEEAYVYLHDGGKAADGAVGGAIEKLVDEGYVVVSVDLRGQGETASGKPDALLGDWKSFYLAYLLGKPLAGMHAEDVLITGRFVANYETKQPRKVHLVAVGNSGIAALHAAALEPNLFASVTLRGTPESWSSVVSQKAPAGLLTTTVHGALTAYDLPDLVTAIGPDKVRLESKP
ncbi:MAG TPA: acetylxylan esterase [Pirellulaceae bacterium]|nr:acetylxylan esterase [Pirellulaceae bacterium]